MRKPTQLHYFYSYKWPVWLWIVLAPLLCVALMAGALGRPPDIYAAESAAGSYFLLLGLAWLFGWAAGALAGPFVLGPIYHHRAQLNGAPFLAGDLVEILVGANRGRVRVVAVVESSDWRGMVRVNLGNHGSPKQKSIFWSGDIFEETQLLKIVDAAHHGAADAPRDGSTF